MTWLEGKTLYLHSIHCPGCQECNGRVLSSTELQELRDRGELGANGPVPPVVRYADPDPED